MQTTYRIDTQTVRVGDVERVVFVGKDDDVWHWVHSERIVICPIHWADVQGQGTQVALTQDGLHKLDFKDKEKHDMMIMKCPSSIYRNMTIQLTHWGYIRAGEQRSIQKWSNHTLIDLIYKIAETHWGFFGLLPLKGKQGLEILVNQKWKISRNSSVCGFSFLFFSSTLLRPGPIQIFFKNIFVSVYV